MKRFSRALVLALGLAASLGSPPPASIAQEIPLEKSSSGAFTVEYAGQHFRVNSTIPVTVRFEFVTSTTVKLKFISQSGASGRVSIYWVEFDKNIYTGPIPTSEPWEGTLNTEGGFVDR
jgi:hypothetical protein